MSVRRLQCPGCSQPVNVPAHLTNVRCPACGMVWNSAIANASAPSGQAGGAPQAGNGSQESSGDGADEAGIQDNKAMLVIGGIVAAVVGFIVMLGIVLLLMQATPNESAAKLQEQEEETIKPRIPEPYREVKLPEEQRKRIYADYRKVARTTTEVPILMPTSQARSNVEGTLQGIQDRELMRFAALHNVEVADIHEIIKEGDAKAWDKSARSNAKRDGKRVYSKEMSEGWQRNPNRK